MKENLGNKIIVLELAGSDILVRNMDNNFEKELAELGFQKAGNLYSLNLNPNNIAQKIDLIHSLINLGSFFSNGKDWSPSEFIEYYKEIGLLKRDYYEISWKNKNDFNVVLKSNNSPPSDLS